VDDAGKRPARGRLTAVDAEVLTWAGLVHRAGSAAKARALVAQGSWWRVLRDAYAPAEVDDGPQVRAQALRLVLPPGVDTLRAPAPHPGGADPPLGLTRADLRSLALTHAQPIASSRRSAGDSADDGGFSREDARVSEAAGDRQ
jgi:hypothetical protein